MACAGAAGPSGSGVDPWCGNPTPRRSDSPISTSADEQPVGVVGPFLLQLGAAAVVATSGELKIARATAATTAYSRPRSTLSRSRSAPVTIAKKNALPKALSIECQTAARVQEPRRCCSSRRTTSWKPALPRMPTTSGMSPVSMSGRCQKIRMDASRPNAPNRPKRRSRTGAAKAVHPASSPSPTNTSMARNVTGTSGQSPSWPAVGSGAPSWWFTSTIATCRRAGAPNARAYSQGEAAQRRRDRPQAKSASRPWQDVTTRAATTGPNGEFSGLRPDPHRGQLVGQPPEQAGKHGEGGDRMSPDELDGRGHAGLPGSCGSGRNQQCHAPAARARRRGIGRRTRPRAALGSRVRAPFSSSRPRWATAGRT